MKKLTTFLNSPTVRLVTAIVLLVSGILELTESALEKLLHFEVRIHHGLIFFALAKTLGAIAELIEGREKVVKAKEEKHKLKA
jgi:hypothetical protein